MLSHSETIRKIYLMGIGGIAMGTLATMLKEKGYEVAGSDQNLYPPMSHHLEALRIPVCQGYRAENLKAHPPDVVVVGNVIRRDNPEAQYVLEHNIPYISMPQAIARFFLSDHKSLVVAGTHGKSTTSSLLAWVLAHAGLDPSALIGAFLKDWHYGYRLGKGPHMVLEGDEYDTAFFDKGPKFLHYRPHIAVITSIEYDHADIFPDFDAVFEAFRKFVAIVPPEGYLIVNIDDPNCRALAPECKGRVITYSCENHADWSLSGVDYGQGEVRFRFQDPLRNERALVSRLPGRHNIGNTLAVTAAASLTGLSHEQIQEGLLAFHGVRRRQEVVGECGGVLIVDDFAHHPTAVKETIRALRLFYPDRRLVAAFEPRTNSSRRRVFEDAYAAAFDEADIVCIEQPSDLDRVPEGERLNTPQLVERIAARGNAAHFFPDTGTLLQFLCSTCVPGDLVLCMSNGSFDGLPRKLLEAIKEKDDR